MPYKQVNFINQASRPKRPEIPENIWNTHREAILNEFAKGSSYAKVEQWISALEIPGFKPSAAQLRLFKQKCGWTSFKVVINASSVDTAGIGHQTSQSHRIQTMDNERRDLPMESMEFALQPGHKRPASIDSDFSAPMLKKECKSLEHPSHVLSPSSGSSSSPSNLSSAYAVSPPELVADIIDESNTPSSLGTSLAPNYDQIQTSPRELLVAVDESSDQCYTEELQQDCSYNKLTNASPTTTHIATSTPCDSCLYPVPMPVQVPWPCSSLGPRPDQWPYLSVQFQDDRARDKELDLCAMHHAADIFMTSGLRPPAVQLYLLLGRVYQMACYPPKRQLLQAIIGASRCATTIHEHFSVQKVIERALLMPTNINLDEDELWLLNVLAVHNKLKATCNANAKIMARQLNGYRHKDGCSPPFLKAMKTVMCVSYLAYKSFINNLYLAFYYQPAKTIELEQKYHLMVGVPTSAMGTSEIRAETALCIRSCLTWIRVQLSLAPGIFLSSKRLRHGVSTRLDADTAAIFCFLWIQWLEETDASSDGRFWTDLDRTNGIDVGGLCDMELLKVMCFLIIDAPHAQSIKPPGRINGARALLDKDYELLLRAIDGVKHVWQQTDQFLCDVLFQTLASSIMIDSVRKKNSWIPSTICRVFADTLLDTSIEETMKQIWSYPHKMTLCTRDSSAKPKRSAAQIARDQFPRPVSGLASSLSGSDLSSMRRIALLKRCSLLSQSSFGTPSRSDLDRLSDRMSSIDLVDAGTLGASRRVADGIPDVIAEDDLDEVP